MPNLAQLGNRGLIGWSGYDLAGSRRRKKTESLENNPASSLNGVGQREADGSSLAQGKTICSAANDVSENEFRRASLPAGFKRAGEEIWFYPSNDGSSKFQVCGSLYFVAKTRDASNASWGILLEWSDKDKKTHRWAMPMSLLSGDGGEIRSALLDRGFHISTTKHARAKFSELLSTVEVKGRARAVTSIGWIDGAFVLPDRTIGDTADNCIIYQGADHLDHAYGAVGDLLQWREGVGCLAIGNSRLAFAIAAAFVGPLLAVLGEEGGGINLRGPSSIGKSTALAAAASVWGSPSFVRQWRATSNGLEGVCVQHNETLLCLDELGQLDPGEAGSVAYMLANGMGKARASRSGAARSPAKWKVMFLSSGEIGLAEVAGRDTRRGKRSAAGQEVRILDIDADAGAGLGLFEMLHDAPSAEVFARQVKEDAARNYGVAGPEFVARIIADRDGLAGDVKQRMTAFVNDNVPAGADGQVARGARRFALIAAAGELAVQKGVLPWTDGEATAACAKIFRQWLSGRGGTASAEDREAIARVRAYLEMHGSSRFESVDADEDAPRIINRTGFWRESAKGREYLFLPEMWKTEVCLGMDFRRVTKVLADRGFLQQDSCGKNSVSVNLPGGIGKTRCYVVKSEIFDSEIEG